EEVTWQTEDLEPDKIMVGTWTYWGGAKQPLSLDELRIYSRPLEDAEVAAVYGGQSDLPAVEAVWAPGIAAHRSTYLGWQGQNVLRIKPGRQRETLSVRQVGIDDARAIYSQAWKVCDGDRLTRWPLTYHGYSFQHEGGLILRLDDSQRWNYLRVRGHCRGQLYCGRQIRKPATDGWLSLYSPGPLLVRQFDELQTEMQMTFFSAPEPEKDAEGIPPVRIREIAFYETSRADSSRLSGKPERNYVSARPFTNWSSEIGRIMLSKYETYDRAAFRCSPDAPVDARALHMKGMKFYHTLLPADSVDRALGAIRARLYFRGLDPGTILWLLVADPINPTRQIADFEVAADPNSDWGGIKALDVTLDIRDTVIPDGRPVWIRLLASRDVELIWDAEHPSRFELLIEPKEVLTTEYRHDQLAYVKDRFIDVSEPRPWGKVPMDKLAERVGVFAELHRALDDLHTRFPADNYARAVHIWTHPSEPVDRSDLRPPESPGAPEWAVYQRAALRKYLDFAYWWIENRQAPNGEFGHFLGDDTDLINDWVSLSMISDEGGRIADSVRRLADTCYVELIEKGINRRTTDPLHAYEDGLNALCRAAEMHPGNPVYIERLMEGTRTVDEYLTGMVGGFRHFRSKLYGAREIVTEPPYDRDILSSTLMLHGALYLGWHSRNARATRLVQEYGDAWLDLVERGVAENGPITGRVSFLPSSVNAGDRSVAKTTHAFGGYGSDSMYLALAEWTGDRRYHLAQRVWLMQDMIDDGMAPDLAERSVLSEYEDLLRGRAEATTYRDLKPSMGNDKRTQIHYAFWKQFGDRRGVLDGLKASWERIELLFPMHTWSEQSADRVAVSKDLVDRMYLGGQPGYRNYIYPTHSISWQGLSPEFAAWVLESDGRGLKLMAYNFEEITQEGSITVWRLEPGEYRVTSGPDADADGVPDVVTSRRALTLAKGAAITVQLPPGRAIAMHVRQTKASGEENYYARPDLAICSQDTALSEDGTSIRVRVHNIGGGEAPRFSVVVRADDGKPDLVLVSGPLEAPHDCTPRIAELVFELPADRRDRQVDILVDPDDVVKELYEGNNTVRLLPR
ncbi:MAG: hypothetical protein HN742_22295, partial [Lentisphaerae bacterium]|nr:hypothetical protein [Lentisphaerota bacterium]MBT5605290.1 hypothetical protein [Lentisphaerota bacterium]MBT7844624.1 hypothetical protein [Lentisphaerota bacterium]